MPRGDSLDIDMLRRPARETISEMARRLDVQDALDLELTRHRVEDDVLRR